MMFRALEIENRQGKQMETFEWFSVVECAATAITVIAFIYMIIRNFKTDFNARIDKLEQRINLLDDRMFLLSTGKTLAQAILEEKLKEKS